MAFVINNVNLAGVRLVRDPELRETKNGYSILSFSIACSESYKTQDGNYQDRPNYFDVTVYGKKASAIFQYMKKGTAVAISGKLRQERWENENGEKRSKVVIIADEVILPGKSESESHDNTKAPLPPTLPEYEEPQTYEKPPF